MNLQRISLQLPYKPTHKPTTVFIKNGVIDEAIHVLNNVYYQSVSNNRQVNRESTTEYITLTDPTSSPWAGMKYAEYTQLLKAQNDALLDQLMATKLATKRRDTRGFSRLVKTHIGRSVKNLYIVRWLLGFGSVLQWLIAKFRDIVQHTFAVGQRRRLRSRRKQRPRRQRRRMSSVVEPKSTASAMQAIPPSYDDYAIISSDQRTFNSASVWPNMFYIVGILALGIAIGMATAFNLQLYQTLTDAQENSHQSWNISNIITSSVNSTSSNTNTDNDSITNTVSGA